MKSHFLVVVAELMILPALAGADLAFFSARAVEEQVCLGTYAEDLKAANDLKAAHPEIAIVIREYSESDAVKFVAALNAEPAVTNIQADQLMTAYSGQTAIWFTL